MASRAIIVLAAFATLVVVAVAVKPQTKLYMSIPLSPPSTGGSSPSSGSANSTSGSATTTAASTTLNIMPLGQFLGTLLTGLFGTLTPNALNIAPLGAVLGYFLTSIFGS